jgi:hypothetical protein
MCYLVHLQAPHGLSALKQLSTRVPVEFLLPVFISSPGTYATHVALSTDEAQLHLTETEYTGESMVMSLSGVQKQKKTSLLELMNCKREQFPDFKVCHM